MSGNSRLLQVRQELLRRCNDPGQRQSGSDLAIEFVLCQFCARAMEVEVEVVLVEEVENGQECPCHGSSSSSRKRAGVRVPR